jgi:DNA-binding MarR family transcriptional regulator
LFREQHFPLDLDQMPLLLIAYYSGAASQQELGTTLQQDKASINRTVNFLVTRGYAVVEQNPNDKRKPIYSDRQTSFVFQAVINCQF